MRGSAVQPQTPCGHPHPHFSSRWASSLRCDCAVFPGAAAPLTAVSRQFARGAITGYRVGRYSGLPNTGVWFYRIGTTLFDCGSPNQAKHVMRAAAEAGVTKVLVSHHHEDHGA